MGRIYPRNKCQTAKLSWIDLQKLKDAAAQFYQPDKVFYDSEAGQSLAQQLKHVTRDTFKDASGHYYRLRKDPSGALYIERDDELTREAQLLTNTDDVDEIYNWGLPEGTK